MTKVTSVSLDEVLYKKAEQYNLKLSSVLQKALKREIEAREEEKGYDSLPIEEQENTVAILNEDASSLEGQTQFIKNKYGIDGTKESLWEWYKEKKQMFPHARRFKWVQLGTEEYMTPREPKKKKQSGGRSNVFGEV